MRKIEEIIKRTHACEIENCRFCRSVADEILDRFKEMVGEMKEEDEFTFHGCNPDRNRGYNQAKTEILNRIEKER